MKSKILVFLGPPYAGKDTQARILSKKINLPVLSMGERIRSALTKGNNRIKRAYAKYAMKGKNLPTSVKFPLLKAEMDKFVKKGFILNNYPANKDDLRYLMKYLKKRGLEITAVVNIEIPEEEIVRRMKKTNRNRLDDQPAVVGARLRQQTAEREEVLSFFKKRGIVIQIDGVGKVGDIHAKILDSILPLVRQRG